jgi:hypothetical protein
MKFVEEIEIQVGEDGIVKLRQPTNEEWNQFCNERYEVGRHNKLKDKGFQARVKLFDKLVTSIDNCEDSQGEITVESKDRFPSRLKAELIFNALEQNEIDVKN